MRKSSKHIVWMSWKDLSNPAAGGAEVVSGELMKRLVKNGYRVTLVTAMYSGAASKETHADGYDIIRLGDRYRVYHAARKYYQENLRGKTDLIIDEINTMPFFARFYADVPVILFVHMMCRRIWFYQMIPPFNLIGWLAEPQYMRTLNSSPVITISESTKNDLKKVGFKSQYVDIISEGITVKPLAKLPNLQAKTKPFILLSLGAMRPMKRTLDQIKTFEIVKTKNPDAQLYIAGDSSTPYGKKVLQTVNQSPYAKDITFYGRVTEKDKLRLLQDATVIMQTSIKEGWGLTVTEANSQGTPAAVYNVDGLRDSVRADQTGVIAAQNTPRALAAAITNLVTDQKHYDAVRYAAWEWSREITFERSYKDFIASIKRF